MTSIIYVGMDVHKDTYSICYYDSRTDRNLYEKTMKATTQNVLRYLENVKKQLGEETMFVCGYEAGPTGFGLCRDLLKADYSCVVMAPTSLKHTADYRIKNDRIDARNLAKTLFTKDYSSVNMASPKEEAIKEYCRMRINIKKELKNAKQVLMAFLLRQGKKYTEGSSYWTIKHRTWLKNLKFDDAYLQEAFNEYMISINTLETRLKTIEARLEEIPQDKEIKAKVDKLVCFSGIEVVTAVSIASEVGDFNRFASAFDFSKYLGLIPAEWSSGKSVAKLGITKAGNCYLRRLLTESAKSIKKSCPQAKKSKRLEDRQKGKDPLVIAYADKCRIRIKSKIKHLEDRGKNVNVATTAAARELACFIWGMMTDNIA